MNADKDLRCRACRCRLAKLLFCDCISPVRRGYNTQVSRCKGVFESCLLGDDRLGPPDRCHCRLGNGSDRSRTAGEPHLLFQGK